ncbi:DUF333 domain-containing protein [Komagataeibacter rhaeticus]|uniref:putative hemolysin n=1 Tax=Komagataeibacter rhaeticus TaxID=215221 RepID=UPI0039E91649
MTTPFPPRRHHGPRAVMALTALSAALAGLCGPDLAHAAPARTGMANPASVYCQQRGGTLELRHTPRGVTGWCHLPDGTVVEEWALLRRQYPLSTPTP